MIITSIISIIHLEQETLEKHLLYYYLLSFAQIMPFLFTHTPAVINRSGAGKPQAKTEQVLLGIIHVQYNCICICTQVKADLIKSLNVSLKNTLIRITT